MFVGSDGEQIITAEHLFRKPLGKLYFGWRKLQPFEENITQSVEKVLYKGKDMALEPSLNPDAVLLKAGPR